MTENMIEFIKGYLPFAATLGSGFGFMIVGISSLLGYVIEKIQELFDN